jgi:hypothetical protein
MTIGAAAGVICSGIRKNSGRSHVGRDKLAS